jgi:hypothetical protein
VSSLPSDLRKQLEKAVIAARDIAETGATKALQALAVHEPDAYRHMDADARSLRNRLRAQARQLGDGPDPARKGAYSIRHLAEKVAYDQWHRLLFARFLLENDLLIHPDHGVGLSLEDCAEYAPALGLPDPWAVAAHFAARELPEIFRNDDPAGALALPGEDRTPLLQLVTDLPREVFTADDSLGWTYQFWQARRKEEVNKSGVKIGADELSPVTQLFTEDYMVDFLLDNTLGAWWAGKQLARNPDLARTAQSEPELRDAFSLPGCPWKYLRFIRAPESPAADVPSPESSSGSPSTIDHQPSRWRPAAGTFPGWPKTAREIKALDPCMGSGHFIVALFARLFALRRAEEGQDAPATAQAVLRDNLYGLEIDPRCAQIAAFNLALAAWKRAGYQRLPAMHLACSGVAPNARKEDWVKLAIRAAQDSPLAAQADLFGAQEETLLSSRLRTGMERLYDLFKDSPILGSLINPLSIQRDMHTADFRDLQPVLADALRLETAAEAHELAVAAQGIAKAAEILAGEFTLVATNVPYLSRNKQDEPLQGYCDARYPRSKTDLATVFIERCVEFLARDGSSALVVPKIWMTYTAYYESLRQHILTCYRFDSIGLIGKNGFETIKGEIVDVSLIGLSKGPPANEHSAPYLDVAGETNPPEKASALQTDDVDLLLQNSFLENPGFTIALQNNNQAALLSQFVECFEGLSRGDVDRFDRQFWELPEIDLTKWQPLVNSSTCDGVQSGMDLVFLWEDGQGALANSDGARVQGEPAWNRRGVFVSRTHLRACLSYGRIYAQNGVALVPREKGLLLPLLEFCRSEEYRNSVKALNQKLIKPTGVMAKVPFDLPRWQRVAAEQYPHGLPKPYSSDPTQWLFDGFPRIKPHLDGAATVAGASSSGNSANQHLEGAATLQVAVARLLGYRWPRQTGSSFPDCPALEPDGLEELADADGIVCLPALAGEAPAAERVQRLLAQAYGDDWSPGRLEALLAAAGHPGVSLEDWLYDHFFAAHCALFHHRPFIWHIWDGLRRGFHVLVNYHQLTRANLEKLTYTHLGDWIRRQDAGVRAGEAGSDARLEAAKRLQECLKLILEGEPPFDLFVRWKPLREQPLGWDPDLNDGVRLNIRPFLAQDIPGGKKGAGLLRAKPNIKWEKDRGTEPHRSKEDFPWFWAGDTFTGNRVNDVHLTRAEKEKARK